MVLYGLALIELYDWLYRRKFYMTRNCGILRSVILVWPSSSMAYMEVRFMITDVFGDDQSIILIHKVGLFV